MKIIRWFLGIKVGQWSATVVLTWSLSVITILIVVFGLVVVWFTNLHSCLGIFHVKQRGMWGYESASALITAFYFFPFPLFLSLKVPAVSLPSFQRMTLSPMTQATLTAAAVRAMTLTRRRSCWMSPWRGPPVLPTLTVLPRLPAPCSGLWGTPPVREPLEVLPPAPQHLLVSGAFLVRFY